ncbi:hypothetical protein CYMTET_56239 [Cymbomonas tetramitiformis]|uniref:J domain-containing protein n=1 Tax=Cymbomonas tetramitiformis TaxID=36881 RepID=A0AAE0EM12_9CHLO|nr:hypothetical protein CYMTET_56239 [Cymbomonas tetramitiformis]
MPVPFFICRYYSLNDFDVPYALQALAHHPDKNASLSEADAMSPDIFQQVQKAWGVLKNSDTRSTYDRHLAGQRMVDQVVVSEEIALDEMACQELEGGTQTSRAALVVDSPRISC